MHISPLINSDQAHQFVIKKMCIVPQSHIDVLLIGATLTLVILLYFISEAQIFSMMLICHYLYLYFRQK